jgi:hypothetical protein
MERQGSKDFLSGTRPVATRSQNRLRQRTKTGDAAETEAMDTIFGFGKWLSKRSYVTPVIQSGVRTPIGANGQTYQPQTAQMFH